ncbi:MAG: PD-(D/E)XK nuclease family protein [Bacteroidota bacterium]|jgi:hypothetical protein|uniref:PDDEXK-like family protein n=1 Tax=Mucilaginibacter inviolabilis TaxID=2714892 RepID=UPI0014085887|nr:PD-(D/E)XK nuclease family protein [Mucilaginibacter inviolabilis]NHA05842.1 PD-(D/E)XK nuclease family protein [Mucilaginibacter inviolabilis]
MGLESLNNLLQQIQSINTRYLTINELTGENFNVFRILKLESAEVRMHSAFIAELLNPKGSHGQKDTFLKLFIKSFCFKQNDIDTESCTVHVEKHTGLITNNGTEGGRIDILVTDKFQNHIIIENKIYAGDQANQILRYYKYSPKADLIYLSLNGKEPEYYSKEELESGIHYKCFSYGHHIYQWLEACRKEVAVLPIIRESLTQYLNLVKYLTNQTLNETMKNEVAVLMSKSLEASFIIHENLDNACLLLLEQFYDELANIANELKLHYEYNIDFNTNYRGFWFWNEEWKHVGITFQFWSYDKDLVYGFTAKSDPDKVDTPLELPIEIKSALGSLINNKNKENAWWPLYQRIEDPYRNWSKYEAWKAIENGEMAAMVKEKIEYLLKLAAGISL